VLQMFSGDDVAGRAGYADDGGCRPGANRVLIVDSDRDARRSVVDYLRAGGWLVDEAADGNAALTQMRQSRPDVVVLEPAVSSMDGRSFVSAWRQDPLLPAVPLVLLASMPSRLSTVDEWRARAGLAKPVDLDVLAAVVQRVACS
jgi:DNA-binding response OmpR family regulator